MAELPEFQIGQTVELQDSRTATVQFVGPTHFAAGDWLGVELDDATGKNDGAVQGERYFTCSPGYGMFVRPAVAQVIDQPTPKPTARSGHKANGTAVKGRPSSVALDGLRRQNALQSSVAKRQSINASSPTPSTTGSSVFGSRSQSGSPSKQLGLTTSVSNASTQATDSTAVRKPPLTASRSSRLSMAPPPTLPPKARQSRQSIAGVLNGSTQRPRQSLAPSRVPAGRPPMEPKAVKRLNSVSGESSTSVESRNGSPAESQGPGAQRASALSPTISELMEGETRVLDSSLSHASNADLDHELPISMTMRDRSPPTALQWPPTSSSAAHREVDDLKTKLRLIEKRRAEDRERLKTLDRVQNERDKFEGIIQKLQAKYQPQQQEIANLKKQVKEAEAKAEAIEKEQAEHDSTMEMITLDREMAEEISESMKTELVTLRQKQEELELEVEILREENQELGKEISPEERTSQGWLQMEKSNERLREALVRLRDVAQQQEESLKSQVKELEKDVEDLNSVKAQYENTKQQLVLSESAVEDLRQRLDTTLGAEEMIEELTEKNLALSEQMESMRATIEDMESLKELNDELELNHNENEKQMQDEIDYKESLLSENAKKSAIQDRTVEDLEYTVNRFRDLVTNLQSDLEDMRASKQITESEANELSSRSRAMLDLNMRLQISANKAQVRAIDVELGQMEAKESAEHLAMVQPFLPDSFLSQRNSILTLLRFRRIGFKAKLMHGVVKERVQGQSSGHEDEIFASCDILDKLAWIATTVDRFLNFIQSCSLDAFTRLEGALYDLEPVERSFNAWIDGLKKSEFKEQQCAEELRRSIALIAHLAEIHIPQDLERYADDVHAKATMMQSHLENAAMALSVIKLMAQKKIGMPWDGDEEEDDQSNQFFQKADALVSQIRSAKVIAGKAIHSLEGLKSRSLTLNKSTSSAIELAEKSASDLASGTFSSGLSLFRALTDDERDSNVTYREVGRYIYVGDSTPFAHFSDQLRSVMLQVQAFHNLTTSLNQTIEFPSPVSPPPWELLAQNIRSASGLSAKYEAESARLKKELSESNTALALKDKILEELSVNIEVLEKRIGESGGRRERVRDLEGLLGNAQVQEREMAAKITRLQQELKDLEMERETWKRSAPIEQSPAAGRVPSGNVVEPASETSLREIALLKTEIQALQSSIRYLRSSSHSHTLSKAHSYLTTPLMPSLPTPTNLQIEAKDVLKEMLGLTTRSDRNVVKLQRADQSERLKWKPVRETSNWKFRRQREEWEEWKEWRDEVVRKDADLRREEGRRIDGKKKQVGRSLAKVQLQLPNLNNGQKGGNEEVKIIRPSEWEELERNLGIAAR